jgi:hypothetical protein
VKLWAIMDEVARHVRPGEATLAHCVASLPIHESPTIWRDMIIGFAKDNLVTEHGDRLGGARRTRRQASA